MKTRLTYEHLKTRLENKKLVKLSTSNKVKGYNLIKDKFPLTVNSVNCKGPLIYMILMDEKKNEYFMFHRVGDGIWDKVYNKYHWHLQMDDKTEL